MADDGETKDDVKVPDGEVGEKIEKLFTTEEKDTSKSNCAAMPYGGSKLTHASLRRHCSHCYG